MSRFAGGIIKKGGIIPSSASASGNWTLSEYARFIKAKTWPGQELYPFTTFTFTSGGVSGRLGPSRSELITSYNTTLDPWLNNTEYFNTSNGIQLWVVPLSGLYRIETWGARGGGGGYSGGFGARMRGDFNLVGGTILKILVGQTGGVSYGGGGGMTAVATSANVPLIVSGGGNTTSPWTSVLSHAVTTTSGLVSSNGTGAGGTDGSGGIGGNAVAGGAGFIGNGGASSCSGTTAPLSFINGGTGGQTCNSIGGFGGGVASDGCCQGASGGGGGYSGGGGGNSSSFTGGAGGSYNIGANQDNSNGNVGTAIVAGNGKAIITKL